MYGYALWIYLPKWQTYYILYASCQRHRGRMISKHTITTVIRNTVTTQDTPEHNSPYVSRNNSHPDSPPPPPEDRSARNTIDEPHRDDSSVDEIER